jgi:hypothetical protein
MPIFNCTRRQSRGHDTSHGPTEKLNGFTLILEYQKTDLGVLQEPCCKYAVVDTSFNLNARLWVSDKGMHICRSPSNNSGTTKRETRDAIITATAHR